MAARKMAKVTSKLKQVPRLIRNITYLLVLVNLSDLFFSRACSVLSLSRVEHSGSHTHLRRIATETIERLGTSARSLQFKSVLQSANADFEFAGLNHRLVIGADEGKVVPMKLK